MSQVLPAAAQRVDNLAQRMFPERPHHLSVSPTRRYPVPPDFFHQYSQLEYMTFLSDTDRGILLTRPYYDIREDQSDPLAPNSTSAIPRSETKKTMNKMSFKDYQQSRAKKVASPMPETNSGGPRSDARQGGADGAKPIKGSLKAPEGRSKLEDVAPPRESANQDSVIRRPRIPSKNGRSPSPTSTRRSPEPPESDRPPKRQRVDSTSSRPETNRTPKPESSQTKRLAPVAEVADRPSQKDVKSASKLLLNGRSTSTSRRELSPPRQSVNGSKEKNGSSATIRASKSETSSKQIVPPLLSPLRLSIDDEQEGRGRQSISSKRPPDVSSQSKTTSTPTKQRKWSLPPLLSPTLPPVIEEELARTSNQRPANAPSSARKTVKLDNEEIIEEEEDDEMIVVLKYKKRNSMRVSRLLALEPASKKEALKKERSISAEVKSPPSKKRPRVAEPIVEQVASKRPRSSLDTILVSKAPAPSTPLKQATAMSRAASSNSQAHTPGGTNGLTPGAGDRPPTSHEGDPAKGVSMSSLRRRQSEWTSLGTQLKHKRDGVIRSQGSSQNGATSDALNSLSSGNRKQVALLSLEMVLSYMVAFDAMNQARSLDRKAGDFTIWESLLPHLIELKNFTSPYRALDALRMQLHALVSDALLSVYWQHEQVWASGGGKTKAMRNCHRDVTLYWSKAHDTLANLHDATLRADLGPWSRPQAAAAAALRVLRRFAEKDGISWRAELSLGISNGV
ncbi:hypothetical protein MCOR25_006828 [Pyricularia grisea]|nr:hypothetical protein MCOR25_006828 [Pyricularia grisea]